MGTSPFIDLELMILEIQDSVGMSRDGIDDINKYEKSSS